MTRSELMENRVARSELELAEVQFRNIPLQLQAKLARKALYEVLSTASVMAIAAKEILSIPIDEHLRDMSVDMMPARGKE